MTQPPHKAKSEWSAEDDEEDYFPSNFDKNNNEDSNITVASIELGYKAAAEQRKLREKERQKDKEAEIAENLTKKEKEYKDQLVRINSPKIAQEMVVRVDDQDGEITSADKLEETNNAFKARLKETQAELGKEIRRNYLYYIKGLLGYKQPENIRSRTELRAEQKMLGRVIRSDQYTGVVDKVIEGVANIKNKFTKSRER